MATVSSWAEHSKLWIYWSEKRWNTWAVTSCKWWNVVYLEPKWSRFFKVNPPQNKAEFPIKTAGSVGFQVYACLCIFVLLGKLFNSDQIAEITPKKIQFSKGMPPKSPENQLKEKKSCPDVGDEMQFLRSDWGFVRNTCHLLVTRYLEDHPISIYRGYNPSYPFISPFEEVITPFLTRRGPPCIRILLILRCRLDIPESSSTRVFFAVTGGSFHQQG